MFAIIGIVIVFGAIAGGYLMEHGNLRVLLQPAELLIIGGASIGTVLIANPLHILMDILGGVIGVFKGSPYKKETYLDLLKMMYGLFNKARKEGLMSLEADVEDPGKSPLFSKHPAFLKNHHAKDFLCDRSARTEHAPLARPFLFKNFGDSKQRSLKNSDGTSMG